MKRIEAAAVLALILAAPAFGQDEYGGSRNSITMVSGFDADDSAKVYCSSIGKPKVVTGGSSREADYAPTLKIKTVGLDGTTVSDTASSGALSGVEVGSLVAVYQKGTECPFPDQTCRIERVVTSKASDDEVEVDPPWDLTGGYTYFFRTVSCGSTSKSGEIFVGDLDNFDIWVEVNQMDVDAGGINVYVECRKQGGTFKIIEDQNITAAGTAKTAYMSRTSLSETYYACRGGFAVPDDDADDTGVHAEKVSIYFSGKKVLVDEQP